MQRDATSRRSSFHPLLVQSAQEVDIDINKALPPVDLAPPSASWLALADIRTSKGYSRIGDKEVDGSAHHLLELCAVLAHYEDHVSSDRHIAAKLRLVSSEAPFEHCLQVPFAT